MVFYMVHMCTECHPPWYPTWYTCAQSVILHGTHMHRVSSSVVPYVVHMCTECHPPWYPTWYTCAQNVIICGGIWYIGTTPVAKGHEAEDLPLCPPSPTHQHTGHEAEDSSLPPPPHPPTSMRAMRLRTSLLCPFSKYVMSSFTTIRRSTLALLSLVSMRIW